MKSIASVSMALFLASFWCQSLASSWMEQPYDDGSFNSRFEYLHNATLECRDEGTDNDHTVSYWIRPDMQIMRPGDDDDFLTIDGLAGWQVTTDGMNMTIFNIEERQFGFYYCVVGEDPDIHVIKKALNYKGPYFGDLWKKYEKSVIISCSAAGGFLVLVISLCCLYSYKYPDEMEGGEGEDFNKAAMGEVSELGVQGRASFSYDNQTYDDVNDVKEEPPAVTKATVAQTNSYDNPAYGGVGNDFRETTEL